MKNLVIIFMFLFGVLTNTYAQRPAEKIETARIAFLTERLSLTPETAQKFWPVYNQFNDQRQELKREEIQLRRSLNTDEVSDDSAQQHISEYFTLKEQQLALEKNMANKLASVLSPVQVVELIQAEAEFQRMVLRKLGERRRGGDSGRRPGRQR